MSKLFVYSLILLVSVVISAFSQILLKKSSQKKYDSKLKEYLNPMVIFAYGLFFGCSLISMYALKVVPLSLSPILEATAYIITPVLSFFFLKERATKRQLLGMCVIVTGIVIFVL